MFGSHLVEIRGLMEIRRYQNKFKHVRRSVAEHSWAVAQTAKGLAIWEKEKFGHTIDIGKTVMMALDHDMVEAYTGDIISTTKNLSSELKEALCQAERTVMESQILPNLPKSWRKRTRNEFHEMEERETLESKVVKAADHIDTIVECLEDIRLGSVFPYEDILKETVNALFRMELDSVMYFMRYSFQDIGVYRYLREDQKEILENRDFSPYFERFEDREEL